MTQRPSLAPLVLALLAVVMIGGVAWRLTWGNAGWRIRHVFPRAEPYVVPGPSARVPRLIRTFYPDYFRADERLGFRVSGSVDPLDLQQRFSQLSGLRLEHTVFVGCRITRFCPVSTTGWPGDVAFFRCDLSEIPADQLARLRPYGPNGKDYQLAEDPPAR